MNETQKNDLFYICSLIGSRGFLLLPTAQNLFSDISWNGSEIL